MADKAKRLAKIRAAKAALEAQAQTAAAADEATTGEPSTGESGDGAAQIIVAHGLTNSGSDQAPADPAGGRHRRRHRWQRARTIVRR